MRWLRERDIDLLVCSELHLDGGPLQKLFVGEWNDGVAQLDGAWVSHWEDGYEIDIVASFKSGSRTLVLHIEDKIGAVFQPDQPERYRKRAQRWKDSMSAWTEVETVLLAPADYFTNEGSETFDRRVSYEKVIALLGDSSDHRTRFLAHALKNGIESYKQGNKPEHSEAATQVWNKIWEMANVVVPQLRMRKPDSKSTGSGSISFLDAEGVSNTETRGKAKIVYKLLRNNADIQFSNTTVATLRKAVGGLLLADMTVAQANKSASIRIKVPAVDLNKPPDGQEESIMEGLQAAERLRRFFIEKRLLDLVPLA
jgi:hypothetical protein